MPISALRYTKRRKLYSRDGVRPISTSQLGNLPIQVDALNFNAQRNPASQHNQGNTGKENHQMIMEETVLEGGSFSDVEVVDEQVSLPTVHKVQIDATFTGAPFLGGPWADNDEYDSDNESASSEIEEDIPSDLNGSSDDDSEEQRNLNEFGVRSPTNRSRFTAEDQYMLELMDLCDSVGAPRYLYDRVVTMIKKHAKKGYYHTKSKKRENVMVRLRKKLSVPDPVSVPVGSSNVIKFSFLEMTKDLLEGSVFEDTSNLCVNENPAARYSPFIPSDDDKVSEVLASDWYQKTCTKLIKDKELDFVIPLVMYTDRTGTDALQRYSLEPWLFSTALVRRSSREKAHAWRHLGFVPKVHGNSDGAEGCRMYHTFVEEIMTELKHYQQNPPLLSLNIGGVKSVRRCHFPVVMILGDQLSQDKICCRIATNGGGASRCHRSCMCSFFAASDPGSVCVPVDQTLLAELSDSVLRSMDSNYHDNVISQLCPEGTAEEKKIAKKFSQTQIKIASTFLAKPFQTHPCINAFRDICFGAHKGVLEATADDVMHATEAGQMKEIADTLYDGLTKGEKAKVERRIISVFKNLRCSNRKAFPRWRLSPGFSNQTLMTCDERAGSILQLAMSLHDEEVYSILETAHKRQRENKYNSFKKLKDDSKLAKLSKAEIRKMKVAEKELLQVEKEEFPDYFETFLKDEIVDLSLVEVRNIMTTVARYNFDVTFMEGLDKLQLAQMFTELLKLKIDEVTYPECFPKKSIARIYEDMGDDVNISQQLVKKVHKTLHQPIKAKEKGPFLDEVFCTKKHRKKKPKIGGDGETCVVLGTMNEFQRFCEYALMYHAWCHYSHTLDDSDRCDQSLMDFGTRSFLRYFDFLIYRGDNSVDTNTCKAHTLARNGFNNQTWGSLMNTSCHLGERLLKTHAKGAGKTAQKRGEGTYTFQTAQRAMERTLVLRAWEDMQADPSLDIDNDDDSVVSTDTVSYRKKPHFNFSRNDKSVVSIKSNGKRLTPSVKSGNLPQFLVDALLEKEPEATDFFIWNEVTLRDKTNFVRAYPNYREGGAWYDWIRCKFDIAGEDIMYPARVLCFYQTDAGEPMKALVHTVKKKQPSAKENKHLGDTILCTHYRMEYHDHRPFLQTVEVDAIDRTIMALASYEGLVPPYAPLNADERKQTVMVLLPRSAWAKCYVEVTKKLKQLNSSTRKKHTSLTKISLGLDMMSFVE